jgi:sugar/nucleoside kinase (ribokinase family)
MPLTPARDGGPGRPRTVLCAGIAVEDFLFRVERFPRPEEKVTASTLVAATGGCAANAAVAVARLGGHARFAGPLGGDDSSRRFTEGLAREGVDSGGAVRLPGGSISISGIFIDGAGEKMVATRRGDRLAEARLADPAALVADIDILLADNRWPDFVRPICAAAKRRGVPVVLDVDKATDRGDPLLSLASHVIFSSEALRATAQAADLATALQDVSAAVPGFLAVTDGPGDVLWLERDTVRRMPVFAVEAVDTLVVRF